MRRTGHKEVVKVYVVSKKIATNKNLSLRKFLGESCKMDEWDPRVLALAPWTGVISPLFSLVKPLRKPQISVQTLIGS